MLGNNTKSKIFRCFKSFNFFLKSFFKGYSGQSRAYLNYLKHQNKNKYGSIGV